MTDVLKVEKRDEFGSAATRRLRRTGRVPAVLYGHGKSNVHLAITEADVNLLLRTNAKTVKLSGDMAETAMVNDMQWDPLGIDVLHLDLLRVNLRESVEVSVQINVHGEAPGVREGGVLLENLHEVEIRCPAGSIPEQLDVDVNELPMGGQLTAGDLVLPEGVELLTASETVIAHIEEPRRAEEEVEPSIGEEPEVIAREGEGGEEG